MHHHLCCINARNGVSPFIRAEKSSSFSSCHVLGVSSGQEAVVVPVGKGVFITLVLLSTLLLQGYKHSSIDEHCLQFLILCQAAVHYVHLTWLLFCLVYNTLIVQDWKANDPLLIAFIFVGPCSTCLGLHMATHSWSQAST